MSTQKRFIYFSTKELSKEQFNAGTNGNAAVLLSTLPDSQELSVYLVSSRDPKKRGDPVEKYTVKDAKELPLSFVAYYGNAKLDEHRAKVEWVFKLVTQ